MERVCEVCGKVLTRRQKGYCSSKHYQEGSRRKFHWREKFLVKKVENGMDRPTN
jgi:ribosomal protein L37E